MSRSARLHAEPTHTAAPRPIRPPTEASVPAHELLGLQRTVGNQAVLRLLERGGARSPALQRHLEPTVVNPDPTLTGAVATPVTPVVTVAQKKYADIRAILDKSEVGKAALKVIDDYKVVVDVAAPGPGSVFAGPAPGKILLESTVSVQDAAFILVHEANHAKASNEGKTANVSTLARDAYVKTMIDEETTSTVLSIQAKRGMSVEDKKAITATPVMEARYTKAYDDAHGAAITAKKTPSEASAAADKAAWDSINLAFYDGSLVTSNTLQTYAVYYGSFWDRVHAPPVAVI